MRSTIILASAFAAFAYAETSSSALAPSLASVFTATTATTTYSLTPAQSSAAACLENCGAGDVDCRAKCVAVPSPDMSQANATVTCVAACPKGNGTAADNASYQKCTEDCIGRYYLTSATGAQATGTGATPATAPSTALASSRASSGSPAQTQSPSSNSSSDSSASSSSANAARDVVRAAGSAIGLIGFMAALLAM